MSAAPGRDYLHPPEPDPARRAGDTSEPVGYDSDDIQGYQQPPQPLPLVRPADAYSLDPFLPSGYTWDPPSRGQSITGFLLSFAGVVCTMAMPLLTAPLAAAGIAVSVTALVRCRLGRARGRGWAVTGLVLGVIDVVLVLSMMRLLMAMMATGDGPGP
jgi:hypothetical protein